MGGANLLPLSAGLHPQMPGYPLWQLVHICTGVEFILPTDVIIADKFDEKTREQGGACRPDPRRLDGALLYLLAVRLGPSIFVPCLMGTPLLPLRAIVNAISLLDWIWQCAWQPPDCPE